MRSLKVRALFIVFTVALLVLDIGCDSRKDERPDSLRERKIDTVAVLLERSRDKGLDESEKRRLLRLSERLLPGISDDSLKSVYLSKLSLSYLSLKDSAAFRRVNKNSIVFSKKIGDTLNLAFGYWDLGQFLKKFNVLDSSYYLFTKSRDLFDQIDQNVFQGQMLKNMAVLKLSIGDYIGAEQNYFDMIKILDPEKHTIHLIDAYKGLGSVFGKLGNAEKANEYLNEALLLTNRVEDNPRYYAEINNDIGMVYFDDGDYRSSKEYFRKALSDTTLELKYPWIFARSKTNYVLSQVLNGDAEIDVHMAEEAAIVQESIEDWQGLSRSYYTLAEYNSYIQDSTAAMSFANRARELAESTRNTERELESLSFLSRIDPENASLYHKDYIELNDSLQLAERRIQDKFARIRYETDEFIAQNESLVRQNRLWISIAAGMLLLAIFIYVIVEQRAKNQKLEMQRQQQLANEEILDLMLAQNQKLEEGKQLEQKRISQELHDGILGQMNGIRMVLLGLNGKTDDNSVKLREEAIEKLKAIQEEIRTISHELNYASEEKFKNFIHAVNEMLKLTAGSANLSYEISHTEDFHWNGLNDKIKVNVYRIVQESVQNCINHARASHMEIQFNGEPDRMVIKVIDDGVGFKYGKKKQGIGHKNIEARVRKLGGSWEIQSTPGNGTTVIVNIPYIIGEGKTRSDQDFEALIENVRL